MSDVQVLEKSATEAEKKVNGIAAPSIETPEQTPDGTKAESALVTGAVETAASDPNAIKQPSQGATEVVTIADPTKIKFAFSLEDVEISLSDVDLVMVFPDGAKLVLVGLGLELFSEIPMNFEFSGADQSRQDVAARIGVTSEASTQKVMNFSSNGSPSGESQSEKQAAAEAESEAAAVTVEIVEVQAPQTPSSPVSTKIKGDKGAGKISDFTEERARVEENLARPRPRTRRRLPAKVRPRSLTRPPTKTISRRTCPKSSSAPRKGKHQRTRTQLNFPTEKLRRIRTRPRFPKSSSAPRKGKHRRTRTRLR